MVSADVDGYSHAAQDCLPDSTCLTLFFSNRREKNKGGKNTQLKWNLCSVKIQFSPHCLYWLLSLRLKEAFYIHAHTEPPLYSNVISVSDNYLLRVTSETHWSEGKTFPHLHVPLEQVHTDMLIIGNKLLSNTTGPKPEVGVFNGRKNGRKKGEDWQRWRDTMVSHGIPNNTVF